MFDSMLVALAYHAMLFISGLLVGYGLTKLAKGLIFIGIGLIILLITGYVSITFEIPLQADLLKLGLSFLNWLQQFFTEAPAFLLGCITGILVAIFK